MPPAVVAPPPTLIETVTDILHGVEVVDPYRWLEEQNSPRTRSWLEEQRTYTRAYFDSLTERGAVCARITELLSIPSVAAPRSVGNRYFFLKRKGNREQPIIAMRNGLFGDETILVDPASRITGTTAAVAISAISEDARFLAYSVRQGGTDHYSIEILDIDKSTVLTDRLPEGFCSGLVFHSDDTGFYYSHRELDDPRPNYRAVFWHRFGTERSDDEEVFFGGEESNLFLSMFHSPEARLLLYAVFSTGKHRRTSLHLQSMETGAVPNLLLHNVEGCLVPFFVGNRLLAYTDLAAPNSRIV